ncbi:hypothetical protein OH77DRAFT_1461366 [Trametes cingulata]|nr:hypothetical protein OH77DRAFT_1461366 [Trametes cingulata]
MSSLGGEGGFHSVPALPGPSKRRKVAERACDYCRSKKIKCDGPRMPNKRCTNCISRRAECTYVEPFNKSRYTESYVEDIEKRLQRAEELLHKLSADSDKVKTIEGASSRSTSPHAVSDNAASPRPMTPLGVPQLSISVPSQDHANDEESDDLGDATKVMRQEFAPGLSKLSMQPAYPGYHGRSGGWVLIQCVAGFGHEYIRDAAPQLAEHDKLPPFNLHRGAYKYKPQPWLERLPKTPPFAPDDFPQGDLLHELVNLYFRQHNDYTPLLHEPTFWSDIEDGLHLRDAQFGAIVLLVCANGARFSDDPLVLLDGSDSWNSAGWKWFELADNMHKSLRTPIHPRELQVAALWVMYMQHTTFPQSCWMMIGLGLRKALYIGAHRNSMYTPKPTVEDELWRRAFWALLTYEWTSSYGLGRPPCLHDEDYDVALPTECDDAYWTADDPEKAFKQPPGKPSKVSFWTCYIRLSKVVEYMMRTLYSLRKFKTTAGIQQEHWEERIVAELDSELNRWVDTVPAHLKWDPACEDNLFLGQSATLWAYYHQVQVMVHRPFITFKRGSPSAFASLIICSNAARASVQILDQARQRLPALLSRNTGVLFMAGLVLLISMWGQRRSGRNIGANKDREYIHKCIDMLHSTQRQNNLAERLRDILQSFLLLDAYSLHSDEGRSHSTPLSESATQGDSVATGPSGSGSGERPSQDAPQHFEASQDSFRDAWAAVPPGNEQQLRTPPVSSSPGDSSLQNHPPEPASHTLSDSFLSIFHATPNHGQPTSSPFVPFPADWENSQNLQSTSSQRVLDFNNSHNDGLFPTSGNMPASPSQPSRGGAPSLSSQGGDVDMAAPGGPSQQEGGAFWADTMQGAQDIGMVDHAFVNDAITMWSDAPASFEWADWEAYFNAVKGSQQAGS